MMAKDNFHGQRGSERRRPPSNESVLHSDKIQIERKTFLFTLKENPRGRFLRITEDVGGRRDSIIIPSSGLEAFSNALTALLRECPPESVEPDRDKPLEA